MNEESQIQLIQDVATTKSMVAEMYIRLFGGDQPGVISKLQEDVKELQATKARAGGVLYTLSGIVTLLGGSEIIKWIRGN